MANSEWDGSPLPDVWANARYHAKCMVIAYLQGQDQCEVPHWWRDMSLEDRQSVVWHLCAVGSLSPEDHFRVRAIGGKTAYMAMHRVRIDRTNTASDYGLSTAPRIVEPMLYSKPNGGKRILPSVYTRLTTHWLRASRVYQNPERMNQGHLANTIALLNESHVNLVDRMAQILGRMHNHLGNRPDLQEKIVDLFHGLEGLQVNELYPIIELLASHVEQEMVVDPEILDEGGWLEEF